MPGGRKKNMKKSTALDSAVGSLAKGNIIVIYDGDEREGEADFVVFAGAATPKKVAQMRLYAGGLLCLATDEKVAGKIGLPFMTDLLLSDERMAELIYNRTLYGDKPSFSISINHFQAKTGISDDDRSKTILSFAKIVSGAPNKWRAGFIRNFRTPGHVNLLIGRGIKKRRGHTELSLELARRGGLPPAVCVCEITCVRKNMTKKNAIEIAKKHGLVFIEGKEIKGE